MKIYNKDLKKGLHLIKGKKYSQALRFLEPKVPIFRDDPTFYYLLAHACFHSSDLGGAKFYLERVILLDPENLDPKLLLALVHIRRKDSPAAAKVWLRVLERDEHNTKAKQGLEKLRRLDNPIRMKEQLEKGRLKNLLPSLGIPRRWFILTPLVLLGLGGILLIILNWKDPQVDPPMVPQREDLQYLDMELRGFSVTDNTGTFHYVFTPEEIEQRYQDIIQYYDQYKDNLAQREINRLYHANVSQEIKAKLAILEGHLKKPDYMDFYTDFSYRQALEEPWLYQNCYILWTGRASNVEILEDRIEFLFLVGFADETQLEGVMPAYLQRAVNLDPELAVEVLGQLEWQDNQLGLRVETIRHIIVE